ncbi:uncharacterized protein [Primulina huaijiensis]|uniref:uncharacterized protein n=1 Tax=Primulina huaijiensis TaxID=1492673 RepID=UPI003CC6F32A
MGFRDFYGFNLAMLGKQVWKLLSDPNATICRIYKAKYYPRGDFLNANIGHNPSFAWRSILASQDPWLRDSSNFYVEKAMIPELHDWTVQDLMVRAHENGITKSLNLSLRKNGAYIVKSGYHVAMSLDVNLESRKIQGNWKALWKVDVPPKIKNFLWRACRKCLPHRINLQKRGIQVSALSVVCNKDMETSCHTFITCPYTRECWANAKLNQVAKPKPK